MSLRVFGLKTAVLLVILQSLNSKATAEPGWVFEQRSKISGEHRLYLSKTRIKSINSRSKISVYTQAPDWKVVVLNDKAKLYCITDLNKFQGENSTRVFASHRDESSQGQWFDKGSSKVLGQKVNILYMYRERAKGKDNRPGRTFKIDNMNGLSTATNWCMVEAKVPKQISQFVSQIYCVSNRLKEFPLRVMYTDSEGISAISLLTSSVKPAEITDALFVVPKSYKQMKGELMVYDDEQSKASLNDLFGWLGEVEKPAAKH